MAIDTEHLPKDPKVLQQMVLDLTAQLDRESAERHKVETILRELLEARRNRKSEQLSADQLALSHAVVLGVNAKAIEVLVVPIHGNLNRVVQVGY